MNEPAARALPVESWQRAQRSRRHPHRDGWSLPYHQPPAVPGTYIQDVGAERRRWFFTSHRPPESFRHCDRGLSLASSLHPARNASAVATTCHALGKNWSSDSADWLRLTNTGLPCRNALQRPYCRRSLPTTPKRPRSGVTGAGLRSTGCDSHPGKAPSPYRHENLSSVPGWPRNGDAYDR